MKILLVLVSWMVMCEAVWEDVYQDFEDDIYEDEDSGTRLYHDTTPKISAFDVGSRMRQYNFMNYYSNTMKYFPNVNGRQYLAKSYMPIDTDDLDKYARYNWLGEEWNPVKDNAIAYNIITSPFIKDATYEFKNIWNGVGKEVDKPVMFWGPNPRANKARMAWRYKHFGFW
eukprot:TRINITY_DN2195_c0_g1_i7.p1 TRINITY_DN2195_c0_g1~~TRINITY_DN2195_c0_g1_i7.p1  ORF type:complete len:171 (-),score=28.20 TRINITY_DN2195_c0_g1_i7:93-605(-)